jgi:hypothetical protein
MPIKTLWDVTLGAARDWWEDNCLRLAASLAYYTALSLAPLILLIVGLLGVVLGREFASVSGGVHNMAAGEHASIGGGRDVRQEAHEGWAAGSLGAEVAGRFRSP